jgi:hypothetical protein
MVRRVDRLEGLELVSIRVLQVVKLQRSKSVREAQYGKQRRNLTRFMSHEEDSPVASLQIYESEKQDFVHLHHIDYLGPS